MIEPWKRIEPTKVTKVGWRTVVTKTFELPDKSKVVYDIFNKPIDDNVAVIALTSNNEVVLATQFRPGPEKIMHELPGGGVDEGESFEAAAGRELLEETGYESNRYEYLGHSTRDGNGHSQHHYFIAYDCSLSPSGQDIEEFGLREASLVTPAQLIEYAKNDQLTDHAGVLLAYDKLMLLAGEHTQRGIIA